jgi:D-ribose pyranase
LKKKGILNSDISRVLSYLGHTDQICIGDCGLPCPDETERIDLAVRLGEPGFMDVLEAVGDDMKVQTIYLAEEMKEENPEQLEKVLFYFENLESGFKPILEFIPHEKLKKMTRKCKAVIRTGETTPYSNIILEAACIF